MQGTPNSAFNPAAASFNPIAPTFLPSAMKPPKQGTRSLPGEARLSAQTGDGISSSQENPFRPHWDGVFGELSAPRESLIHFGASQPPPRSSTPPKKSWSRGPHGATAIGSPYDGHQVRPIGHAVQPSMAPAGGWGFDSPMELDIHALMKAQNKASTPLPNVIGVGLGLQFTEKQWKRLGVPNQPTRKDSGIENQQHGAALAAASKDQSNYPPRIKSNQLPQVTNGHDVVKKPRSHLSDYPDEKIVPRITPPIFQPVPTTQKPAFLPQRISNTPSNHAFDDYDLVDYSKHRCGLTGRSAFHQQLPQSVTTPNFSYGDYHAQRYGAQLNRPSTTNPQARPHRGKPLGRRRIKIPRIKRTDQGPMPSSADIYPDDARVGGGALTYPNLEYENLRVSETNGVWNDAEGADGPTEQWTATVQEELRRQAEAEAQHNEYLRSEEVAQELEELIRSQGMHPPEDMHHHKNIDRDHGKNNIVNDYAHNLVPTNMPLVLQKPYLLLEKPINAVDDQPIMLHSPLLIGTTKGHSTSFSVFNSAYYRTVNQVKASMNIESRPMSPAQLDGSRYGMRFWGIGIGDSWDPETVAPETKFRVRPREHEGWGGWEWVKEHGMVKHGMEKVEDVDRMKGLWDKEV